MKRPRTWVWLLAGLVGGAGAACDAILGINPPPVPRDAGSGGKDAGGTGGVSVSASTGSAGGGDASAPVCAALDAGLSPDATVAEGTYFPLGPITVGDGGNWDFYLAPTSYWGGTFDGRYVYFAGRGVTVTQYDTQGAGFEDSSSWVTFDVNQVGAPGYFAGAVFDGRYVYFIPNYGSTPESTLARYDTRGSFASPASWTSFNVATVPGAAADAGPDTQPGFWGAGFDGRYLYLVPYSFSLTPFVADGRILRYDTGVHVVPPPNDGGPDASEDASADAAGSGDAGSGDAGSGEDAGDAGSPDGGLADLALWESFDLTTLGPFPDAGPNAAGFAGPNAAGFAGAVFDGQGLYLVPFNNGAYGSESHSGYSSTLVRLTTNPATTFATATPWKTYDLTALNGLDVAFIGGAFDGRYLYLAPRSGAVVPRYDTTSPTIVAPAAWSNYDLSRQTDAGDPQYFGAAFDGRFVYFIPFFVPAVAPYQQLARYDTLSPYGADCAWTLVDLGTAGLDASAPTAYAGAVFDGEYLYLIPSTGHPNSYVARFHARTPGSMPALPAFHGSFW